jgi:hypothetical protein
MLDSTTILPADQDDELPVSRRPDLTPLSALLRQRGYTDTARTAVLKYADQLGTLEGCTHLDPAHRADADAILEASWPAIPPTSPAWDKDTWRGEPSRWTITNPSVGLTVGPPELEDKIDRLPAA